MRTLDEERQYQTEGRASSDWAHRFLLPGKLGWGICCDSDCHCSTVISQIFVIHGHDYLKCPSCHRHCTILRTWELSLYEPVPPQVNDWHRWHRQYERCTPTPDVRSLLREVEVPETVIARPYLYAYSCGITEGCGVGSYNHTHWKMLQSDRWDLDRISCEPYTSNDRPRHLGPYTHVARPVVMLVMPDSPGVVASERQLDRSLYA